MYHGSGGGVGLDRLWLVGLDRCRGFGSVPWVWIGAVVVVSCDCGCWWWFLAIFCVSFPLGGCFLWFDRPKTN